MLKIDADVHEFRNGNLRLIGISFHQQAKFLRLAATAGVGAFAADAVLIEPNRFESCGRRFGCGVGPLALDGFTIALLSDFHYDPYFSVHPLRASIEIVNALHPDMIVLTGDFVSVPDFGDPEKGAESAEPCAEILSKMQALWSVGGDGEPRRLQRS